MREARQLERNGDAHPHRPVSLDLLLRGPYRLHRRRRTKGPNTTVSTPSVGRPAATCLAQAALSSEAFTPYAALGLSNNDGLAPGESSYALARACMTAAGYPERQRAMSRSVSAWRTREPGVLAALGRLGISRRRRGAAVRLPGSPRQPR